ncbi:CPBP family intramembrane glutamic endopeptidase [Gracilibacillus thailandensis]|uniref:CPBP family intramembrane metalloprotease n=1 Tax=Gracilibacillus thailandensis TaxID=563735 RepID=A0A6N7QWH2_9BACI|nr:CPBP family intramembrane glutamic endopeptidase [Gracilibacillus thailandensis]MRI66358.1 CPBP family intramembrane metalloprotease [Gracilibacillus thailandensis]
MKRLMLFVVIACLAMAVIELYIAPNYLVKSICKLLLFLFIPYLYIRFVVHLSFKDLFSSKKKYLKLPIILASSVSIIILSLYWIIGSFFDFSNVTVMLEDNMAVDKNNFLFVAIYIALVNSLLEEFFFRGFAFLALLKMTKRWVAYLFSAGTFALYHIAMMTDWFSIYLFVLILFSLFVAGYLFNKLDEKADSILPSWLVHISANVSINLIGMMLFGII